MQIMHLRKLINTFTNRWICKSDTEEQPHTKFAVMGTLRPKKNNHEEVNPLASGSGNVLSIGKQYHSGESNTHSSEGPRVFPEEKPLSCF